MTVLSPSSDASHPGPAGYRLPAEADRCRLHLFLAAAGSRGARPRPGCTAADLTAGWVLAPDAARPVPLVLDDTPDTPDAGLFREVDPALMPGLYALTVPQTLRRRGCTFVHLRFVGCDPIYLELHGVGYDPYDAFAIGLRTWIRSNCHTHLTSGLRKSMLPAVRQLLEEGLQPQP